MANRIIEVNLRANKPLEELSDDELIALAKEADIDFDSSLDKEEIDFDSLSDEELIKMAGGEIPVDRTSEGLDTSRLLPQEQAVEHKIQKRGTLIEGTKSILEQQLRRRMDTGDLPTFGESAIAGLGVIGTPGERMGSVTSGQALRLQRGQGLSFDDAVKAVSGERVTYMSDVYEAAGADPISAAIMGGISEIGVEAGITKAVTAGAKLTSAAANNAMKTAKKTARNMIKPLTKAPTQERYSKHISKLKSLKGKSIKVQNEQMKKITTELVSDLQDKLKVLSVELGDSVKTGAGEFQVRLPRFFKDASDGYIKYLDEMTDNFVSRGGTITDQEIQKIIVDTFSEGAANNLVETGPVRSQLSVMLRKYSPNVEDSVSVILDPSGKPIVTPKDIKPQVIDLKEVINDVKGINKTMRQAFNTGFTDEDVIGAIFHDKYSDFLETKGIPLKGLNTEYKKIIQAKKAANRIFKPYKGEFETKTSEGTLKRVAMGRASRAESDLINFLEEGSKFGKGTGNITQSPRQVAAEISKTQGEVTNLKEGLKKATAANTARIERKIGKKIAKIERKKLELAAKSRNIKIALIILGSIGALKALKGLPAVLRGLVD